MSIMKVRHGFISITVAAALTGVACQGQEVDPVFPGDRRTIEPPPAGRIYLGQTPARPGEVRDFEQLLGEKVALFADLNLVNAEVEDDVVELTFDTERARTLHESGYIFSIYAFEAFPAGGFTVDKLLAGVYDDELSDFARQLRAFGQPMFFHTAREPNGVLANTLGGFGPDGDQDIGWAVTNGLGLAEFVPQAISNPEVDGAALYAGLGDDTTCDGLERIAAAQRYYYDFFIRREDLNFLTFETTGWANSWVDPADREADDLLVSCSRFADLYRGIADYSDWVSLNYYMITPQTEPGEPPLGPVNLSDDWLLARLAELMDDVRRVAPGKPVIFNEIGFCDETRGERAREGLDAIIDGYPEVRALTFWNESSLFPCAPTAPVVEQLKRKQQEGGVAYAACGIFSDGTSVAGCSASPTDLVLPVTYGQCLAICLDQGGTQDGCSTQCD